MTREQMKQKKRQNRLLAVCLTIIAVWVLCLALSIHADAAFDAEQYKTTLSVVGAVAVSACIMRVVSWLDGER